MIYLDHGATSFPKPPQVCRAVARALETCANPGRGGYGAAMAAAEQVYVCRERAAALFSCRPEQVVFTNNCTHGLNIALASLVRPGAAVVISGFEHNAVTRPLHALGARIRMAGRKLFDWADTLAAFDAALTPEVAAVVCTHVSNVFGYILPVGPISRMCRDRGIPLILDAAQSAGTLPVSLEELGAAFIAMPGHKGLLGPQGTGLLLCADDTVRPLLYGGTGAASRLQTMPPELPERLEAGTLNVPGIAGLAAGLELLLGSGLERAFSRERRALERSVRGLEALGMEVFAGAHQGPTVSFRPGMDCQEAADDLARRGIAVRAGLHCAPLAHESAGTADSGTVRVSFGRDATPAQAEALLRAASKLPPARR